MPEMLNFTIVDFKEKIESAIKDEILISCGKWGVSLNKDEKEKIVENTFKQIPHKLEELGCSLNPDNGKVMVTLRLNPNERRKNAELGLFKKNGVKPRISRINAGFVPDYNLESRIDDYTVEYDDFPQYFEGLCLTWAKTAVFYAVGSFKENR